MCENIVYYDTITDLKNGYIHLKQLLLTFIIFINLSFANTDLINIYRQNGLKAVENLLNQTLMKKSYWDEYLKNIDVTNGYYESIQHILICTKDMQDIQMYNNGKTKNKLLFEHEVFTGEKSGAKQSEGDLKTPIGVYKFTQRLTKLDEFYGPVALVTSYPNNFDKLQGKTGSGIWIHGLPQNQIREPFTKGCIALDNKQLTTLNNQIDIKKSILIIKEKKRLNISKNTISNILSQIFSWKQAWQLSDIDKYLSFYSQEFKKSNGTGLKRFKKYKKRVFAKNEEKSIIFTKINIIPYPNNLNKNMFKITLFEKYKAPSYKFTGNKELYIEIKDNKIRILHEG